MDGKGGGLRTEGEVGLFGGDGYAVAFGEVGGVELFLLGVIRWMEGWSLSD